jgi:hypothetical protein
MNVKQEKKRAPYQTSSITKSKARIAVRVKDFLIDRPIAACLPSGPTLLILCTRNPFLSTAL